jgi:hypothetical protein
MRLSGLFQAAAILLLSLISTAGHAGEEHADVSSAKLEQAGNSWILRESKDDLVFFQGEANFDGAGTGANPMFYPGAAGLIGIVAAVATHAIVEGTMRGHQKSKLQEQADVVLKPYQDILSTFSQQQLFEQAITEMHAADRKFILADSQGTSDGHLIDATPVFSLTQDQSAIVLDAAIVVFENGAVDEDASPTYQNVVRVVSLPHDEGAISYWTANQGEQLKSESAHLLASAVDLALADVGNSKVSSGAQPLPYKTVRYQIGKSERMERGQVINEDPDRLLIKTLRGWLMSVPKKRVQAAAEQVVVPSSTVPSVSTSPTVDSKKSENAS